MQACWVFSLSLVHLRCDALWQKTFAGQVDGCTASRCPAFVQLDGGLQVNVSADGLTILTEGNPGLKPIESLNADLSGEWSNLHAVYASQDGIQVDLPISNLIKDDSH